MTGPLIFFSPPSELHRINDEAAGVRGRNDGRATDADTRGSYRQSATCQHVRMNSRDLQLWRIVTRSSWQIIRDSEEKQSSRCKTKGTGKNIVECENEKREKRRVVECAMMVCSWNEEESGGRKRM